MEQQYTNDTETDGLSIRNGVRQAVAAARSGPSWTEWKMALATVVGVTAAIIGGAASHKPARTPQTATSVAIPTPTPNSQANSARTIMMYASEMLSTHHDRVPKAATNPAQNASGLLDQKRLEELVREAVRSTPKANALLKKDH